MSRPAYAALDYASTLAHVGRPLDVAPWGTATLLRDIPGRSGQVDAMGPYPVCVLAKDADIAGGLEALRQHGAVAVVLVADPLAGPADTLLARHFPLCRPFKTHQVLDRRAGPFAPSKHHRDRIRRGQRHATARPVSLREPAWRACWRRLYAELVARRGMTGLHAFPDAAFDRLATLPDHQLQAIVAEGLDGSVLAMQLWIRDGGRAYSHLTATSEAGYRLGATYVLYAAAVEALADCAVLDFGGGAGAEDCPDDPLATFKRGFANAAVTTRLCGAVLDPVAYARLSRGSGSDYFPAYRAPPQPLRRVA